MVFVPVSDGAGATELQVCTYLDGNHFPQDRVEGSEMVLSIRCPKAMVKVRRIASNPGF